jgi:hypothetical protein
MKQNSGVPRGGFEGFNPPKFRSFDKAEPNSQIRGKYIRNNLIRTQASLICKLSGTLDQGATAPRSPYSLPSVLNWICWTPPSPRKKILGTPLEQNAFVEAVEHSVSGVPEHYILHEMTVPGLHIPGPCTALAESISHPVILFVSYLFLHCSTIYSCLQRLLNPCLANRVLYTFLIVSVQSNAVVCLHSSTPFQYSLRLFDFSNTICCWV